MNKKYPITVLLFLIALLFSWQAKSENFQVPYSCSFSTSEQFDTWTTINANNDNRYWYWSSANGGCANYGAHISNQADDWLISPAIYFPEAGVYTIGYDYNSDGFNERMKVYFGNEPTIAGQKNLIKNYQSIKNRDVIHDETLISITTPGIYYFSFQAYSMPTQSNLFLKNISIKKANDIDLQAISISGKTEPMANRTSDYNLLIKNNGALACSNYKVQLLDEGNTILCEYTIQKTLQSTATQNIPLQFTPTEEQIGPMKLKGKVIVDGDQNIGNTQTPLLSINVIPFSNNNSIEIGNGTTATQNLPFNFYYNSSMSQAIYLESEIAMTGEINKITYFYNTSATLSSVPIKIYICHTELDNLSSGWIPYSNFTKVYESNITIPSGISQLELTLDTPFQYNGGNICVMTERPKVSTYKSGINAYITTVTPANRVRAYYHDTNAFNPDSPQSGSTLSTIPNIQFQINVPNAGSLSGYITDAETNSPIENALISIPEINHSTTTSITGRYSFPMIHEGSYQMTISAYGYLNQTINNVDINENINTNQNIALQPAPKHTITSTSGIGGDIDPEGEIHVVENDNQTFNITPKTGFEITDVLIDNVSIGAVSTYTFENVTTNHTIHANFSKLDFIDISIGTGFYSTNNIPFQFFHDSGIAQTIYLAEELGIEDGLITQITYFYSAENEIDNYPIKVSLCETLSTNMAGGWIPQNNFTLVYNGNISIPSGQSEVTIVFDNPFIYKGGNICIFTERPYNNVSMEAVNAYYTLLQPTNRSRFYGDFFNYSPFNWTQQGELTTQVPNIRLHIEAIRNGSLSGLITSSGVAVQDANVTINPIGLTTTTDVSGNYTFTDIPIGTYSLSVSKTGYEDILIENVEIIENTNTIKNIVIQPGTYTISATAGANGTISPSGNISVSHGSSKEFSITPNQGYHITDVSVNESSIGTVSTYKFENITANQSIRAEFGATNYILTLDPNGGEVATATIAVTYGQPVGTLPTPTKTDHNFIKWTIDDVEVTAATIWNHPTSKTAIAQWESLSCTTPATNLTAQHIAGGNKLTWTLPPLPSETNQNMGQTLDTPNINFVINPSLSNEGKDNNKTTVNQTHTPTTYQATSAKTEVPEGMARITLSAGDIWGDGSGYQFLMGTNLWGTVIPATGGQLTSNCNIPAELYDNFTYKIPTNANGSCTTTNIVINNSISIDVPAGMYDFCIANPTPNNKIYIASGANARKQNYNFEEGAEYKFTVVKSGQNDNVTLEVTGGTPPPPMTQLRYCTNAIDDGIGTKKADSFEAAVTFDANTTANFVGQKITAIKVGIGQNAPGLSNTSVWIKNTLTGNKLVSKSATMISGWNTIELDTPYTIEEGLLVIGYSCSVTGGYPLGISLNEQDAENGGNLALQNEWTTLAINGIQGNLCIEGILAEGYSVNVYRDGVKVASQIYGTSYTDNYDVTLDVCYTVEVNCIEGGVSPMSNQACLTGLQFFQPNNVNAEIEENNNNVNITWTPGQSKAFKGYKVWRFAEKDKSDESAWTLLTNNTITTTSFKDTKWNALLLDKYQYAVKAIYDEGTSVAGMSNVVEKTTYSAITDLRAEHVAGGNKLTWTLPLESKATQGIESNSKINLNTITELKIKGQESYRTSVNPYHISTTYQNDASKSNIPAGMARITLSIGDVWGDGTGYQFLMGTGIWGTVIPSSGPLTNDCNIPAGLYDNFKYKIPVNANGSCTTSNIVINNSISIDVPAGKYDYCIANPVPGDKIWIASGEYGCKQNYNFEEGAEYKFTVIPTGQYDKALLEIIGGTSLPQITQLRYCTDNIDDGIGIDDQGIFEAAITFSAEVMSNFEGRKLTAIKVGVGEDAPGLTNASVWIRNTVTGNDLVSKAATMTSGWNTIELDTPYIIGSGALAIGYTFYAYGGYPMGISMNEQNAINGGYIGVNGIWSSLAASDLPGNNCIEGILSEGLSVNIYRDGVKIASDVIGKTYTDKYDIALDACYTVEINFPDGGTSPMSNQACVTGLSIPTPSNVNAEVEENNENANITWTAGTGKAFKGYNVWRFSELNQSNESSWTLLTTTPITSTLYRDTKWKSLDAGKYKYAVKAIYDEGTSAAGISNTVEKTVGVNNVDAISLNIYPNPIRDIMYIDGEYTSLEIYSTSGKLIMTVHNERQVNVSELTKGVYLIKAYRDNQVGTYKIVK